MFADEDAKETKRPFALIAGVVLAPFPWLPSPATDTRLMEAVHVEEAPRQVSRTNTSLVPFVSPGTRLSASDENAMKRPSALIAPAP
jgi:hypothetical protein